MTSETSRLKEMQSELKEAGYKYLGYENGFYNNPSDEFIFCETNHKSMRNSIADFSTCDHLIWCDHCKHYWKIDSGD